MIVKLKAGLGNMMFQYAFGKMLTREYGISNIKYDKGYYQHKGYEKYLESFLGLNTDCKFAGYKELNDVLLTRRFYNPMPYTTFYRATSFIEWKLNRNYYLQRGHDYISPELLLSYSYLDGYWQNWKYIREIRKELIHDFSIKDKTDNKYIELLNKIKNTNSVALCVRKGDYLSSDHTRSHFYNCQASYYENAVRYIEEKCLNPCFYVFTNDDEWVKENLKVDANSQIIFRGKKDIYKDYEELQLIAACNHAIISNSTFHWWGAWLNQGDHKNRIVIRPKLWFADGTKIDIYPPEWIPID